MGLEPRLPLDVGSRVRSERPIPSRRGRRWTIVAMLIASVVPVAGTGLALLQPFGDEARTERSAPAPIRTRVPGASGAGGPTVMSPTPTIVDPPGTHFTPITGLGGAPDDPVFGSDVELVPAA